MIDKVGSALFLLALSALVWVASFFWRPAADTAPRHSGGYMSGIETDVEQYGWARTALVTGPDTTKAVQAAMNAGGGDGNYVLVQAPCAADGEFPTLPPGRVVVRGFCWLGEVVTIDLIGSTPDPEGRR